MGRTQRKKKHTHVEQDESALPWVPKTFVMERGKVGSTLNQLVLDLRQVMKPYTASKLKVHQKNVLKDFVHVAGPLGVTHFLILSRTEEFVNFRVCRLPRGPTITFHVKAFSLSRDVISSLRKPVSNPAQFLMPPLLVLNNFTTDNKLSKLMTTMFQNMFPSINIHTVKLANIRRCVLFNYDPTKQAIEFRHYNIHVTPRGMSRGVKKLTHSQVPNLGRYGDISDYVLGGNVSESEGEDMAGEGEVTLPQDLPGRGNIKSEQSAIRLSELGPRMSLQLVKIESGLCGGEVLHHQFIHKSRREVRNLRRRMEEQRRLKERRRRQQEANVLKKRREREQHRQRSLAGQETADAANEDKDVSSDDDVEWYRQEVGEDPDPDAFVPGKLPRKRKAQYERKFSQRAKRHKQATSRNPTTSACPTSTRPTSRYSTGTHPISRRPTNTHATNRCAISRRPTSRHPTGTRPTSTRPTSTRPTSRHPTSRHPTSTRPTSTHPTSTRPTSTRPTSTYKGTIKAKKLKRLQGKRPRTGQQSSHSQSQQESAGREPLVTFVRRMKGGRSQDSKSAPHKQIKKRSAGQVFRKRAKAS